MIVHSSKNPLLITEASKEDADKLESLGREEHDLRKGAKIVNAILNEPKKYRGIEIPQELQDEYNKKYEINDIGKFNSEPEKTRKKAIRDAVKKSGFIRTSDSSDAALKITDKSKKYDDIDMNASVKGMKEEKANAIKRAIASGTELPDSIKNKLVKKSGPIDKKTAERYSNSYFRKSFSDDEKDAFNELKSLYEIMKKTNDYNEYKKAYDRFLNITGHDGASHIDSIDFQGNQLSFSFKGKDKEEKAGSSKYYHTSLGKNIGELYPTFKSSDGVYYNTPRVYFNKDKPMNRMGGFSSNNASTYSTEFDPDSDIKIDSELNGDARYKETRRAIRVNKE